MQRKGDCRVRNPVTQTVCQRRNPKPERIPKSEARESHPATLGCLCHIRIWHLVGCFLAKQV
jgi:hypothetical protein